MFVYVTASNGEEAKKIARHVLEKKLAACVNIFPISSMYWWKEKIEESDEVGMIIKTKSEKFKELRNEIKSMHSYTTPCICAIALEDGSQAFLNWINSVVSGQ
jgi:periplasmic divalent cation tolerance protein